MTRLKNILFILMITCSAIAGNAQIKKQGKIVTEKLVSTALKENKIGVDVNRTIKIYLPPTLNESAANLRSMRGIAFDWGGLIRTPIIFTLIRPLVRNCATWVWRTGRRI